MADNNIATSRTLRVLFECATSAEPRRVAELNEALDMTPSMVRRALRLLECHAFVTKDATGQRYRAGHGLFALGPIELRTDSLQSFCRPAMQALRSLTGETVSLSIPVGRSGVVIETLTGAGQVVKRDFLGVAVPLHAGAIGRAILSVLPDEEIVRYAAGELSVFTESTVSRPEDLWAAVWAARRAGYARGFGDYTPRTFSSGIGVAVLDAEGGPHGAIGVSGPSERFTDERIGALLPEVLAVVDDLNRTMRTYSSSRDPIPLPGEE